MSLPEVIRTPSASIRSIVSVTTSAAPQFMASNRSPLGATQTR